MKTDARFIKGVFHMKPEFVCPTMDFENGADPSWSRGNSPIIRVGNRVFLTNPRVHAERRPLNRTTMELWEKQDGGAWQLVYEDEDVFQREPCPIACIGGARLVVTANVPAQEYAPDEETMDTDCIPTLYVFDISGPVRKIASIRLQWDQEDYAFWEHSYRGFAVDRERGLLFLDNIEYSEEARFCYTLLDRQLRCIKNGKLHFPKRCCYHTIAAKDGEIYLFGIQDIKEPNSVWRDYKRQMTGREWDYDFRILYMNYCSDIEKGEFEPSVRICDRDDTCGWVFPLDCCYDANGDMLLLVSTQNVYPAFMRERFFPGVAPEATLEMYRFSRGKLLEKTCIARSGDTESATAFTGCFHTAASGEVYAVWCKHRDVPEDDIASGAYLSRVNDLHLPPLRLMDDTGWLFGSKVRLGAAPCDRIDITWHRSNEAILYAGVDLKDLIPD